MNVYRITFAYFFIVLVSVITLSFQDAFCFGKTLKSEVQDEIDQNPFLKKEGIKLRVTDEQNGYLTIEMYEGNKKTREVIHENGWPLADIYKLEKDGIPECISTLQITIDTLQKIKDVKSIKLTALVDTPIDKAEVLFYEGIELYKKKNYSEAILKFNTAMDLDPTNYSCLGWMGNCYRELGNYQQAIKYYNKRIELDPSNSIGMYQFLSEIYMKQNNASMVCKNLKMFLTIGSVESNKFNAKILKNPFYEKIRNEPCFQELVKGN